MKKANISELASRLQSASTTPLVAAAPVAAEPQEKPRKGPKRGTVSVFLRLPPELFAQLDAEAVSRTKATGRGVTVQQVILDRLTGPV